MKHDKKNITAMVTGMVIGAALVSEAAAGIIAEPTWQKIYEDGQQVSMTAYNIAGNNFVRLRDIGQQVGFNVYWENGVQIDTDARRPELPRHRKSAPSRQRWRFVRR